ncbi:hypothetical protein RHMOL_Rhmol01G0303200 [Rhododendron molle]|nr:hypothetical protein RHMOL_Rhmol01G0303200 [Rhododendron molle]
MFGVMETKVRSVNLPHSTDRCFPAHWQYVHNLDVLPVARIIVGWDPQQLAVSVVFSSPQMLMVSVDLRIHQKRFYASIIYGLNLASERVSLWRDLRFLHSCYGSEAWVLIGDFNAVRRPDERLDGFDVRSASDFNSCLEDVEMQELVTKGYW